MKSKGPAFVNKILNKKWKKYEKDIHKFKLHTIKPVTDNKEPVSLKFPLLKSKGR